MSDGNVEPVRPLHACSRVARIAGNAQEGSVGGGGVGRPEWCDRRLVPGVSVPDARRCCAAGGAGPCDEWRRRGARPLPRARRALVALRW
eukprot:5888782-Prymnesium_polylepis.1